VKISVDQCSEIIACSSILLPQILCVKKRQLRDMRFHQTAIVAFPFALFVER
jgi:hypothetical protein